jgi:hypothetical protein
MEPGAYKIIATYRYSDKEKAISEPVELTLSPRK